MRTREVGPAAWRNLRPLAGGNRRPDGSHRPPSPERVGVARRRADGECRRQRLRRGCTPIYGREPPHRDRWYSWPAAATTAVTPWSWRVTPTTAGRARWQWSWPGANRVRVGRPLTTWPPAGRWGIPVLAGQEGAAAIAAARWIFDGITGTGLRAELTAPLAAVIERINVAAGRGGRHRRAERPARRLPRRAAGARRRHRDDGAAETVPLPAGGAHRGRRGVGGGGRLSARPARRSGQRLRPADRRSAARPAAGRRAGRAQGYPRPRPACSRPLRVPPAPVILPAARRRGWARGW